DRRPDRWDRPATGRTGGRVATATLLATWQRQRRRRLWLTAGPDRLRLPPEAPGSTVSSPRGAGGRARAGGAGRGVPRVALRRGGSVAGANGDACRARPALRVGTPPRP